MQKVKVEGLEIDEKIALGLTRPKPTEWEHGAEVMIRNDLRKDLAECLKKLAYHTRQANEFDGWMQVLEAHPDKALRLDHEDYLFFFGQDQ
jgi:hypothetical protein